MKPKVLKTKSDYETALREVESRMDATPGSREEAELELWALLTETYENEHFAIEAPDAVEAIRFRMEQLGLRKSDLRTYMKSQDAVSAVMGRKKNLTLPMIRSLSTGLRIPAEILVRPSCRPLKKKARLKMA
jgi:HTH-type transcriptional regulator/antitoxin HigA